MNQLPVDDELLCAYIDNELDLPTRAWLDKELVADAALKTRLDELQLADKQVQSLFNTPLPVNTFKPEAHQQATNERPRFNLTYACAFTLTAAVAFLIGLSFQPSQESAPTGEWLTKIAAHNDFQHTMEKRPSGEEIRLLSYSSPIDVSLLSSYKTRTGTYCREFLINQSQENIDAVVCRDNNGHWNIMQFEISKTPPTTTAL